MDISTGGSARGRRRSLDSEINMIPMIDLLMVTISFLLITAVWSHMARLDADAQVPGHESGSPPQPATQLHVDMRSPERFGLAWKQGGTTLVTIDVPRREVMSEPGGAATPRFPDLAAGIEATWKAHGQHTSPVDRQLDQAVLHTANATEFKYIVSVLDAIYRTHRDLKLDSKVRRVPAFSVAFATD
jgi:hypothetical protein